MSDSTTPTPGYAPPPPGYGQDPVAATNALAIVALILSLLVPPGGIICGHIALGQIRRTHEQGHGMALAGTIIGYVVTALNLLAFIGIIVFAVAAFAAVGSAVGHLPTDLSSDFPT